MAVPVKTSRQIEKDWQNFIVSKISTITDFNEGSVIKTFIQGGSEALHELYVHTHLTFSNALNDIPETVFGFERKKGTKAKVDIVFTRDLKNESGGETFEIPNFRVQTPSGLIFEASSQESESKVVFPDGQDESIGVEMTALDVGKAYNVSAGQITQLISDSDIIKSCNNESPAIGGTDVESDIRFKARFQTFIEGLGKSNKAGLLSSVLKLDEITSARIDEFSTPKTIDKVNNVNAVVIVHDDSSNGVGATILTKVQNVIDENRAAGVNIIAVASQPIDVYVEVEIIRKLENISEKQIQDDITDATDVYINNLTIQEKVVISRLISEIMKVSGLIAVDVGISKTEEVGYIKNGEIDFSKVGNKDTYGHPYFNRKNIKFV